MGWQDWEAGRSPERVGGPMGEVEGLQRAS